MNSGELLQIDIKQAAGQKLTPTEFSREAEVYHYLAVDPDLRKAELLAEVHSNSAIVKLKAMLSRGRLEEVKRQLEQLSDQGPDSIIQSELLNEKARLAAHEGDWQSCVEFCNASLTLKPALISILTALQIRAVAAFELGQLDRSLKDVEMVLGQAAYYPQAVSVWFSKILKIKILARTLGLDMITDKKNALWDEFSDSVSSSFNLMQLLSLFRLEVDLARLKGTSSLLWSEAALLASDLYGDELYRGLALVDCIADSNSLDLAAHAELQIYRDTYKRIRVLIDDALTASPQTESGKTLRGTSPTHKRYPLKKSSSLYIQTLSLIISFKNKKVVRLEKQNWFLLLERICSEGVSKKEFFETQWRQKYNGHLHDGVIRTFLHRHRKKTGLPFVLKSGRIFIEDVVGIWETQS